MGGTPVHLLRVCETPGMVIAESRWEAIEEAVREGLCFGVDQFIIDLTGAAEVRPLDYWMLLNLAILIPAGGMVVVCEEAVFARSLAQSKLIHLITCVPHLADAYAALTGIAVGPAPANLPALHVSDAQET